MSWCRREGYSRAGCLVLSSPVSWEPVLNGANSTTLMSQMRSRLEGLTSAILTVTAVAVAAALLHGEFFRERSRVATAQQRQPEYLPNWQEFLGSGTSIGNPTAPIKIIEFGDFECPYCRVASDSLRALRDRFAGRVALVFVHYPLNRHRFARPAARVAECAGMQGRFEAMHDELYSRQDSLGLKSWASYAAAAGVRDTIRFNRCATASDEVAKVNAGVALGNALGVTGTPTLIVNGWRFFAPPVSGELENTVSLLLQGLEPFPSGGTPRGASARLPGGPTPR